MEIKTISLKPYFQEKQVKLITKVRKNMSPEKLSKAERYFLGKRTLIETVLNTPDTEVIETSLSICGRASWPINF
jgi:hypothetical protein